MHDLFIVILFILLQALSMSCFFWLYSLTRRYVQQYSDLHTGIVDKLFNYAKAHDEDLGILHQKIAYMELDLAKLKSGEKEVVSRKGANCK